MFIGLLAGLWEFLCIDLTEEQTDSVSKKTILKCLLNQLELTENEILNFNYIGEVMVYVMNCNETNAQFSLVGTKHKVIRFCISRSNKYLISNL